MNNRVSDLIHLMSHAKTVSRQGFDDILGDIVEGLSVSGWELGPHVLNFDTDVLAFTADGRAADLCHLDHALCLPLKGNGWLVQAGIPPKAWDGFFTIELNSGLMLNCESKEWQWQFSELSDGLFELTLFASDLEGTELSENDKICAARIAIFGEIGEKNAATHIRNVKFGSAALSFNANKLSEFRNWFLSKMPTCCYRDEIEALILLDQGH